MVASCVAFNCTNRSKKDSGISFFGFPLGNPPLLKRWILAIKRDGFRPNKNSRICSMHFGPDSFQLRPGASYPLLRQDAVPSLFDFSKSKEQLWKSKKKVTTKRKLLRELDDEFPTDDEMPPVESNIIEPVNASRIVYADHCYDGPKFDGACTGTEDCSTKTELESALTENSKRLKEELTKKRILIRKKVRTLQQQIRRRDKTVRRLKGIIHEMKDEQEGRTRDRLSVLRANLDEIPAEIFDNELKNSVVEKEARRYSETIKEFAVGLYTRSPSAYDYMRTVLTLPSPSLIKRWALQSQSKKKNVFLKQLEVVEVVNPAEFAKSLMNAEIIQAVDSVACPNVPSSAQYIESVGNVEYVNGAENGKCTEPVHGVEFFHATENIQLFHPMGAVSNIELAEAIRNAHIANGIGQQIGFEIESGFVLEDQQ